MPFSSWSLLSTALSCFGISLSEHDPVFPVTKSGIKTGIWLLMAFFLLWLMYGIIARRLWSQKEPEN